MARRKNRKVLKHWAFIRSISNYSRGVARAAETAFAYFGHTLSPSGRQTVMNRLMGNDKQGMLENDTLHHKQSLLLRVQKAIILCYDNYQRGMEACCLTWWRCLFFIIIVALIAIFHGMFPCQ